MMQRRSFRCVWVALVVGLTLAGLAAPAARAEGEAARARAFVEQMEADAGSTAVLAASPETSLLPETATVTARDMIVRVLLGLALILTILAAVLFLYRKATRGSAGLRRNAAIDVLTQRSLGNRTGLSVVRVAGETLLLGVTQHQVSMLANLTHRAPNRTEDAAAVDALLQEVSQTPEPFERTLAGEVSRVRQGLWTSLKRLESEGPKE